VGGGEKETLRPGKSYRKRGDLRREGLTWRRVRLSRGISSNQEEKEAIRKQAFKRIGKGGLCRSLWGGIHQEGKEEGTNLFLTRKKPEFTNTGGKERSRWKVVQT